MLKQLLLCLKFLFHSEGKSHLQGDVTINAFEDCITVEQYDARTDSLQKITFSLTMLEDLAAALDLPEGAYKLRRDGD